MFNLRQMKMLQPNCNKSATTATKVQQIKQRKSLIYLHLRKNVAMLQLLQLF